MVPTPTLAQAEAEAVKAAAAVGAHSLADMRALSAEEIQKDFRGARPIVEGYLIPEDLSLTFANGRQQDVDTLLGSNKDEGTFFVRPGGAPDAYVKDVRQRFGEMADAFLKMYPGGSSEEAYTSQLAGYRDEVTWLMRTWAEIAGQARQIEVVRLLLHAGATGRRRTAEPGRHAHRRAQLRLQQSAPRSGVDRCGSHARRRDVELLGELRRHWRPQRQGTAGLAGLSRQGHRTRDAVWAVGRWSRRRRQTRRCSPCTTRCGSTRCRPRSAETADAR